MALAGVHIVCSIAGENDVLDRQFVPLMNGVFWSQNLTTAGRTTLPAPRPQTVKSKIAVALPMYHIYAAVDAWVSFGDKNVVAASDPRVFIPAGQSLDILVQPGTFVAYTPAV